MAASEELLEEEPRPGVQPQDFVTERVRSVWC